MKNEFKSLLTDSIELLKSLDTEAPIFLSDEETNLFQTVITAPPKVAPKAAPKPPLAPQIAIEPPKKPSTDFSQLKAIMSSALPEVVMASNQKATTHHLFSKLEIIVLTYRQGPKRLSFLKHLSKAIDITMAPCKLIAAGPIEAESNWDLFLKSYAFKLIVISKSDLQIMPGLLRLYRHLPQTKQHFIGDIELALLPDIESYLQNPLLKPGLYKALKEKTERLCPK